MDGITTSVDMNLSILREMVKEREIWCAAVHGGRKEPDTTERLNNNILTYILSFVLRFYAIQHYKASNVI